MLIKVVEKINKILKYKVKHGIVAYVKKRQYGSWHKTHMYPILVKVYDWFLILPYFFFFFLTFNELKEHDDILNLRSTIFLFLFNLRFFISIFVDFVFHSLIFLLIKFFVLFKLLIHSK